MTRTGPGASNSVVAVAGPVGAGKSTLVAGLAAGLPGAATVYFDHYEQTTREPVEKIAGWMRQGADPGLIVVPGLGEDLEALKRGDAVSDPATGARIEPGRYILFETQFGRWHVASGRPIDYLIWLDTPLDIALARKVRQFAARQSQNGERDAAGAFVPWLETYLDSYLSVVGELLRLQREIVAAGADLVIDGMLEPAAQREKAARAVLERFA